MSLNKLCSVAYVSVLYSYVSVLSLGYLTPSASVLPASLALGCLAEFLKWSADMLVFFDFLSWGAPIHSFLKPAVIGGAEPYDATAVNGVIGSNSVAKVKVSLWSIFLDQPAAFVCLCEFSEVKSLAGKEALIFESGDTLRTAKAESHFM
ncbi:hypothetical protein BHE74_00000386 [Ensete ventricosum]|nr:hypothetical protein GW17_00025420 [Ensete ventricosum]RWW90537.1 hypothetical protein BHE74_00000386 [Ensete ventricosum]RZR75988.1 hypothetical protein BHM03_00000590 [Ensete ventricosum]